MTNGPTVATGQKMVPPRFLFRLAAPCHYKKDMGKKQGVTLGDEYLLPLWCELDGAAGFAQVKAAWNEQGLALSVRVKGKQKPTWCRESRLADSDGLNLWIDTRPAGNVHRASRFCHHLVFLPTGSTVSPNFPVVGQLLINRAKEQAEPITPEKIHTFSQLQADGYLLEVFLEAGTLTGFNPRESPQIGFTYLVQDAELGQQTFSIGKELPFREDPSVWAVLDLVP